MIKAERVVRQETAYIAVWVGIFSLALQAVFLLTGRWNLSVLLGNLWSGGIVILNFFVMGLSVQKAVSNEEKEAKKVMKLSQTLRTMFLFVWVVIGVVLPYFSTITTIIPLFFPRIAIALRPLWKQTEAEKEVVVNHENE